MDECAHDLVYVIERYYVTHSPPIKLGICIDDKCDALVGLEGYKPSELNLTYLVKEYGVNAPYKEYDLYVRDLTTDG